MKKKYYINTINDLEEDDISIYKTSYIRENQDLINKHLTSWEISILNQTILASIFAPLHTVERKSRLKFWRPTEFHFGKSILYVPVNYYVITDIIDTFDVDVDGLFHGKNLAGRVQSCINMLEYEISERTPLINVRDKITENFNIYDMTMAFKEILGNYENTIIPKNTLPIIMKISEIPEIENRLILYHYLYISLPKFNRYLLESAIYFIYRLHDHKINKMYQINMEGIATLMMPHLLLKKNEHLTLDEIYKLVKFTKELILNFKTICRQQY
ncbi:Rho-type GTPase-activating protein [Vairimorpha necatrix]|uniref:Rho-type GTPase-activating protein n=1 Tax=Vairimorpha necatrix TaxID=6039 RepID=A0AAX4JFZ0_9MICR